MERFPQQITETSMKDMKEIILRMVNAHQGIKGVDLALKVMSEISPVIFNIQEYWDVLNSLIGSKEIIEVEYTLPQMTYRIKIIYFPKGTEVYGNYIDFQTKKDRNKQRYNAKATSI